MKKVHIPHYTIIRYFSWYFVKIHFTRSTFQTHVTGPYDSCFSCNIEIFRKTGLLKFVKCHVFEPHIKWVVCLTKPAKYSGHIFFVEPTAKNATRRQKGEWTRPNSLSVHFNTYVIHAKNGWREVRNKEELQEH